MNITKFKIDSQSLEGYNLFGICSHIKDYVIAGRINKNLKIKLKKIDNFIKTEKGNDFFFSIYMFENDYIYEKYYLLSNKNINNFFFNDYKQFDFIFIVFQESNNQENINDYFKLIEKIQNVLAIREINFNDGKMEKKYSLISDIEAHINSYKISQKKKNKQ